MIANLLTKIRFEMGNRLNPETTLWLSKMRRKEHPWQHKLKGLSLRRDAFSKQQNMAFPGVPGRVILHSYDALENTHTNLQLVREQLEEHKIEFVELPDWTPFNPRLVVQSHNISETVEALLKLPAHDGWVISFFGNKNQPVSQKRLSSKPSLISSLRIYRRLLSPLGQEVSHDLEQTIIEFWAVLDSDVVRLDGGHHVPGTLHRQIEKRDPYVEYLTPSMWHEAVTHQNRKIEWDLPHLYQETAPIDIVYTWVDGNDPKWLTRKNNALTGVDVLATNETATGHSRFASRNELKYSLRSVEAYASWVNHIYIVTDDQVPDWLDTSHPKITIVDHRDIFSDTSNLPVFNSHAIESQLHHIPGLNERYLYMNDDIFFMKPITSDLFFTSNGFSKFFPSTAPLDTQPRSGEDMPVLSAAKQGRDFIRETHRRVATNKFKHTPHPQLKSVLAEMELEHPQVFNSVAKSKFRHADDYSIASGLYHFHAYATGKAIIGNIKYKYVDIGVPEASLMLDWLLRHGGPEVLCLNDTHSEENEEERLANVLHTFLENRFPIPSSFEQI